MKEPACHCKRCKRHEFDPWVGKIPWRRAWQSTPVFLPGESHGQRSLAGYSPCSLQESDRTEATSHTHSTFRLCILLNQQTSIVILCVNIQMLHGGSMCSILLNLLQVRYTVCASIYLQLFVEIPTTLKSAIFSTIISISPELLMSVAATLYFNHNLGLQGRCPGGSQRSLGHPLGTRS